MTKNSTILPKKPKTGQTYDNYTDLNAQQNPQISNISKKSNFTNFNNSQGKAPQTTQFSSNSLSSANLQKTSLTGLQNNSSQNYGQIAKIPVPIKSSNFTNNSAITAQNTQSFQSESSVKNSNNSTKILQNQPEIKPFIRQNQSKLQEKIYIGETQKVNWTESLKAKIDKSGKELEVLKNLENSYKLPSFDQKQEKNTQNETFQEFRHDDYNNQNIENRQIPERLQNKILETVDEKLDKIHQTGQEWRQNQENVTSQNNLQNGAANQASNSINSSSQVIGFGQNSTKPTNTNLQTENQLKNPRIEQNLQRIKETGEQNRQKLELEKLAKINSQGLLQKIDPKNTKLESVINSGKSVISKQNFTEYLENLQNNSQNSQIEKNGQNDNLQTLQKSQTQKNTNNQPQIGAKIGISQQDSQKNLETKVITTSLPKTSPNFEQNSQENRVEKNLENLEIAKTSNQNENSNNLGLALGNKEIKSTTLVEKSQEIGQKIELEKPKSFIEKLNQIKNNALKKIGITSISRTSLNLANTGIIGLNDGLTTELNLRGNLQEDFEASKILRLLQALAFSTGKNGQENLINKLGQFDGPFFELNPAFPFGGSNNLFATFSALLERNQQFLALICKKEITKENREKYLTVIKNHLKDKENQRFWATLLFVSYQSGNEAIVFGPLALLTGNYTKLPFVNNLIKKAYGIFDGLETTASGETRNFASDFEAQIRKKYDEIKLKETYAVSMSANSIDIGKSSPNFESLVTYQFAHKMLKEVAKSPEWSFLDKERSTTILPGTILESEARFFICGSSNNPNAITKVEEEIIKILALWFAIKFRNFLGKLVDEQIVILQKEKKEKTGTNNTNLSSFAIASEVNLDKNAQSELEKERKKDGNLDRNSNYSDYDNSAQNEFDKQVEIDTQEAENYAKNEVEIHKKAAARELEENQTIDQNKTTNSTTNSKIHPAEIAAKKEKKRIEREFAKGKITQKQRDSQIQNVTNSLAKQLQSYNSLNPNVAAAIGLGAGVLANSGNLTVSANVIRDLAGNIVAQGGKFTNQIYGQNNFQNSSQNSNYNANGNWQNGQKVQFKSPQIGENIGSFTDPVSYNSAGNFVAPSIGNKAQSQAANLTEFGRIVGAAQSSTSKGGVPTFGKNNQKQNSQNPNLSQQGLAVSGVGLTSGAGFGTGQGLGTGVNFGANFENNGENLNSQIASLGANSQINGHSVAALLALSQINHKNHPNIDLPSSLKLSLAEILPHLSPQELNLLVKHLLGLFNQKPNLGVISAAFNILETKFLEQKNRENKNDNENIRQNSSQKSGQNEGQIENKYNPQNSQNSNNPADSNLPKNERNTEQNDNSQPNLQNNQNENDQNSQNLNSNQKPAQNPANQNGQKGNSKDNQNDNSVLPNLTIPKNNSPQFLPNTANPSGFVPFSPNGVSSPKSKIPKNNLNSQNSKNNENLPSSGQIGQSNSQENLNSQDKNYYQIILQILAEYCNVGAIQNPQNGETGIVPFLTENEYHKNYSKDSKVNNAEYKLDNSQSREAIVQKVKTKTGDQNLPNQIYETDFEQAKKSHNDKYLGNLGNIDDKDKNNSQNDNEEKQASQGVIDPNNDPNAKKNDKTEDQKNNEKGKENQNQNKGEKPETGQINDTNSQNSDLERNNEGNGSYLGDDEDYSQKQNEIGEQSVKEDEQRRKKKIKNEKNGETSGGENPNSQNSTSNGGQNPLMNNKYADKLKNKATEKLDQMTGGRFSKLTSKLGKARDIANAVRDPNQFIRDKAMQELQKKAAAKLVSMTGGALSSGIATLLVTIAWVLILIFVLVLAIVGVTGYSYCTKDPFATIFNLTESGYQSVERAFGITPEDEKEKNILEKAAGFVIDRSGVGIVKGIYDAVTGAKIRVQSQVGKYIMKLCGISECDTGSSPKDVRKGSSGVASGTLSNLSEIDCSLKALMETISGAESNGAYDVIYAGQKFDIVNQPWHPDKCVLIDTGGSNDGQCSSAAGKYQFILPTWCAWAKDANIPIAKGKEGQKYPDGKGVTNCPYYDFSAKSQELAVANFFVKAGVSDIVKNVKNIDDFEKILRNRNVACQWTSSPYASELCGTPGNEVTTTRESKWKIFQEKKSSYCAGANDLPKAAQNNPNFPNPLQFFGPIQVSAADKYRWINPVDTNETRFNTSTGKFTSYDTGSGGVDVRLGFPGKPYEESKLVPLVAHLSGEVVYVKDRGSATTVEGSYGTEIGIFYPDLKTAEFPNGVTVYYAHLNDIQNNPSTKKQWQVGEKIAPGQRFGTQGASGSLRPFGDNYLIDVTIKPGKDGASRGGAINGLNDVYNKLWLGMLSYYDANTDKILASNFSPTTGIAGSGSDSPIGSTVSDKISDPNCDCFDGGKTKVSGTEVVVKTTTTNQTGALAAKYLNAKVTKTQEGQASFYGGVGDSSWNGRQTASGEIFDDKKFTAASNTLPLGTIVKVTSKVTGKSVIVKINDTGGFTELGRIIDLSHAAAVAIGSVDAGIVDVKVEVLGEEKITNNNSPYLPHPTEFFAKAWGGIEAWAAAKSEIVEYKGKDGVTVRGTLYTPEGFDATKYKENIVILGHDGFNGDGSGTNYYNKNLGTGQRIANQGSPVFVMEYESGAASRGGPQVFSSDVDDTIQAMNMLQERLKIKNNFTLAGSSRGAGVSALAANRDARVSKLAVAYPVAELSGWTNNSQVYNEARKRTGGDFTKLDLANNPPANKDVQILVSYGDNDTVLKEGSPSAIASVQKYADSLKAKGYNVTTEVIKGGDHGYITVNSGLSGDEQKAQTNFLAFAGGKGNMATDTTGSIPRTVTGDNCNTFCEDTGGQLKRVRNGVVVADSEVGNSIFANNSGNEKWNWANFGIENLEFNFGGIEVNAATSISKAEIPKDLYPVLNTMLNDNKLDATEINNLRDQVAGILGNPSLSVGDKTLYQNLKLMLDDSVNNKKEIKVGSGQGEFTLTIETDLKKTNVVGGATGDSVVKPSTDLSSYKKCEDFKSGTNGGTGGSTFKNDGTVAKGAESLLQRMIQVATGNKSSGNCYSLVYWQGLMKANFGKITSAQLHEEVNQDIARSGRSHLYAKHFGEWLNDKGPDGRKNSTRLGITNLLDANPNMSPYDAPPGSIIVVTPGSPGTSHIEAGDITVKGMGDKFYNDGEMGYSGRNAWSGSKGADGQGRVIGIYTPPT